MSTTIKRRSGGRLVKQRELKRGDRLFAYGASRNDLEVVARAQGGTMLRVRSLGLFARPIPGSTRLVKNDLRSLRKRYALPA